MSPGVCHNRFTLCLGTGVCVRTCAHKPIVPLFVEFLSGKYTMKQEICACIEPHEFNACNTNFLVYCIYIHVFVRVYFSIQIVRVYFSIYTANSTCVFQYTANSVYVLQYTNSTCVLQYTANSTCVLQYTNSTCVLQYTANSMCVLQYTNRTCVLQYTANSTCVLQYTASSGVLCTLVLDTSLSSFALA